MSFTEKIELQFNLDSSTEFCIHALVIITNNNEDTVEITRVDRIDHKNNIEITSEVDVEAFLEVVGEDWNSEIIDAVCQKAAKEFTGGNNQA